MARMPIVKAEQMLEATKPHKAGLRRDLRSDLLTVEVRQENRTHESADKCYIAGMCDGYQQAVDDTLAWLRERRWTDAARKLEAEFK